jgi:mono/diheme cytochrome c family protein
MRPFFLYLTLAAALCANQPAFAQPGVQSGETKMARADPQRGSTLAQRWCASCHIVSRTQSKGGDGTPSFREIADRADFSVEKLVFFLLYPHPMMPGMSLSRDEARDLAAYIDTQR